MARAYGNVYVAQIAMGANDLQATKALLEAEAYPGTSLVIAYSTCIAHGIDMSKSMSHQKDAVQSGYWPLYRFHPSDAEAGPPLQAGLQDAHGPRWPTSSPPRPAMPHWPVRTRTRRARLVGTGPGRRHRAVALLRTAGGHAADRSRAGSTSSPRSVPMRATATTRRSNNGWTGCS